MSSPAATPAALTPSPPAAVLHTETWTVRADDTPAHLEAQLAPAAAALARDELVAFPTETVYGLASSQGHTGTASDMTSQVQICNL